MGLTWGLLALAQPGVLRPDGFGHLAFLAIGPWAWAAVRPGRFAFLVEWLAHALGLAAVFAWMVAFLPPLLAPMAIVPALYPALVGLLLRRTAPWPLALLAPAAWLLAEVVRCSLPVPLSFGWFRLGMLMHDTAWIVGSAAWFGTWGLSWMLAALGGFAADVASALTRPAGTRYPLGAAALFGLGPLAAAIALTAAASPPDTEDRFDVLVVQPGIEQEIKAAGLDPLTEMFVPQVDATLKALVGERPETAPDVVMWGETFLPGKLAGADVLRAFDEGARPAEWAWPWAEPLTRDRVVNSDSYARDLAAVLFGEARRRAMWRELFELHAVEWADRVVLGERLIPDGTSFLTGVEAWTVVPDGGDGAPALRSLNAVAVWTPEGVMGPLAPKVHVVPGGEAGDPLRPIPFVLDTIARVASAVPDFVGADEPVVLTLAAKRGAPVRLGVAICFDNAFDDPFTTPLRRGPVDAFVVASNEAWYDDSPLMDHMLAFTRIAAAASQRAIVRATNSGVSCLVGPDGRRVDQLEVDGRRKMVRGTLRVRVPVPVGEPGTTFFARTQPRQPAAFGLLGALVLVLGALRGRRGASGGL